MSSLLDLTLDDIIIANNTNNANADEGCPARGSSYNSKDRSTGPIRNQRGSRIFRTPHTPTLQNVSDGSKIQISNLGPHVSQEDLKVVFSNRVGPLKRVALNYDQDGRFAGTALLHFIKVEDAARAMRNFNSVQLDGKADESTNRAQEGKTA